MKRDMHKKRAEKDIKIDTYVKRRVDKTEACVAAYFDLISMVPPHKPRTEESLCECVFRVFVHVCKMHMFKGTIWIFSKCKHIFGKKEHEKCFFSNLIYVRKNLISGKNG